MTGDSLDPPVKRSGNATIRNASGNRTDGPKPTRRIWSGVPDYPTSATEYMDPQLLRIINNAIKSAEKSAVRTLYPPSYHREVELRESGLYPSTYDHPDWKSNFALLVDSYTNGVDKEEVWEKLALQPDAKLGIPGWFGTFDHGGQPEEAFLRVFNAVSSPVAAEWWPAVAFYLLLHSPSLAVDFLSATGKLTLSPSFNMKADCFWFLETFHYKRLTSTTDAAFYFHRVLLFNLSPFTWSALVASQRGIRLYLRYCDPRRAQRTLSRIIRWNVNISLSTALYLLMVFYKYSDHRRSLHTIRLISRRFPKLDSMEKRILVPFAKILELDTVVEKDGRRGFKFLPEILNTGIKLNRTMFNIIISNALYGGGTQLGLEVLSEMENRGFGPDSYTYTILLSDAVKRGDRQRVDLIVQQLETQKHMITEPHIVAKILHAIPLLARIDESVTWEQDQMFSKMLSVYSRAHDVQPLIDLSILPPSYPQSNSDTKSRPSSSALVPMISAFLQKEKSLAVVCRVIDRFSELVKEGHDTIGPVAESEHIYNVFIGRLMDEPLMLEKCVSIVNDMSKPLPPTAVLKSEGNRPIQPAKPTVYTWTNLLRAFVYKGQFEAIGRIRDMMSAHDVAFNSVTWTVIISSFVSRGMVDEVAAAVRGMIEEGCQINSHTINAIGKLRNPEHYRRIMEMIPPELDVSYLSPEKSKSDYYDPADLEWKEPQEEF